MPKTLSFPRLNHTNYAEWSMRMEAVLVCADLWALVTGDEKISTDEKDAEKIKDFRKWQATCKAEMVLCIDNSQLLHMGGSDPKLVWEALVKVHCAQCFGSCLQLCHQFITASMFKLQSMESWIGNM